MGYSPRGRKESDTTERLHFHFYDAMEGKCREKKEEMDRTKLIGEIYGKG